jgi:XRE family aerobic/anaerobic benzoate catabolism transcriptional regulator
MAAVSAAREQILGDLGRAVRARRMQQGLTLRDLSEKAEVSVRFLAELEAGRGNVSVARLHGIAVALGTTASTLLADEERRAHRPPVVALLGLRGAGKSTVGKRLAHRLKVPFVELDAKVEAAAGLSLGEVFELHGEAFYRRLEREQLQRQLDADKPLVLATGGSLVNDEETFALLRSRAITVWLQASPDSHWQRVVAQGDRRPMQNRANAMSELRALLRQRAERYARADLVIDTDALGVDGVVDSIAREVRPASHRA